MPPPLPGMHTATLTTMDAAEVHRLVHAAMGSHHTEQLALAKVAALCSHENRHAGRRRRCWTVPPKCGCYRGLPRHLGSSHCRERNEPRRQPQLRATSRQLVASSAGATFLRPGTAAMVPRSMQRSRWGPSCVRWGHDRHRLDEGAIHSSGTAHGANCRCAGGGR
jgi:hypothetical protein